MQAKGTAKPGRLRTDRGFDGGYSAVARRHVTPPPGRWGGKAGPPGINASPPPGGRRTEPQPAQVPTGHSQASREAEMRAPQQPPPAAVRPTGQDSLQPRPGAPLGPADRAPHPRRRCARVGTATNGQQLHGAHSPGLAWTLEALSRREGRGGACGIQHRAWHRINALGYLTPVTYPCPPEVPHLCIRWKPESQMETDSETQPERRQKR
uniref:basic proline-rich protein-like n=1 Tax=Callithrix jacchus TaxID=9483 RepID=UPI0023DCEC63|nr:basic proline-rich protein-like [Callithrix jacchus]